MLGFNPTNLKQKEQITDNIVCANFLCVFVCLRLQDDKLGSGNSTRRFVQVREMAQVLAPGHKHSRPKFLHPYHSSAKNYNKFFCMG